MAYEPGRNPFNPLIVGAIAVIVALAAFLILREGVDTSQQAGIESPPAVTSPAPVPPPAATKEVEGETSPEVKDLDPRVKATGPQGNEKL